MARTVHTYRKLNWAVILLIIISAIILFSNISFFLYYKELRQKIIDNSLDRLDAEYQIIIGIYSDLSDFIYKSHINSPEVLKLFAEGVYAGSPEEKNHYRQLLYRELSDIYELTQQYNFRQLHFHESNNYSYLRFHSPQKYGDDLTGIRYSVEYVNKDLKPISGFEEGRIFNGYRFVYPVSYQDEHIGSVEVSISMKTVLDQLQKRFGQKADFIMLKKQVEKKVFESELSNYTPWLLDEDYLLDKEITTEHLLKENLPEKDINKIKTALDTHRRDRIPFAVEISLIENDKLVVFFPVNNFSGEKVAYIFALFETDDLKNTDLSYHIISRILLLLLFMIVLFSFYFILSQKKIRKLMTIDSLTNCYVRRIIMERLEERFKIYQRYQLQSSVIMLDVDHFKRVNDNFGHTVGDSVLKKIVNILKVNSRVSDSIGRYGGEEFILLLPETDLNNAAIVAEKLRKAVAEYGFYKVGKVTISLGVSEMSTDMKSIEELITEADNKLYRAKNDGRNKVVN